MTDSGQADRARESHMRTYRLAFEAALRGRPERAARLATLEQACGHAETEAEFRVHSLKIAALVREVEDELAPDWPQVWYSSKDQPAGSGQFEGPHDVASGGREYP